MPDRSSLPRVVLLSFLAAACGSLAPGVREAAPWPVVPASLLPADSARGERVAAGVAHRFAWSPRGPWAVHVLEVDLGACWTVAAAKGPATVGAVGRATTSATLEARPGRIAAVNGDFFLFDPPGAPVGPHVENGRVIAGPGVRPALIVDHSGRPTIDTLRTTGWLTAGAVSAEISRWNRPARGLLGVFDRSWGMGTLPDTGAIEVSIDAMPRGLVTAVDTLPVGIAIPERGAVVVAGGASPLATRLQLRGLRPGLDSASVAIALVPAASQEAVGGFPILLRNGELVPGLDSAGGARFGPVRHPRTAVGIDEDGRRLWLVVVDGRQPGYSEGMTLRELALLLQELGAVEALNLDGGGSTAMVLAPERRGSRRAALRVVNRPSDQTGERAVGNALVVERGECTDGVS